MAYTEAQWNKFQLQLPAEDRISYLEYLQAADPAEYNRITTAATATTPAATKADAISAALAKLTSGKPLTDEEKKLLSISVTTPKPVLKQSTVSGFRAKEAADAAADVKPVSISAIESQAEARAAATAAEKAAASMTSAGQTPAQAAQAAADKAAAEAAAKEAADKAAKEAADKAAKEAADKAAKEAADKAAADAQAAADKAAADAADAAKEAARIAAEKAAAEAAAKAAVIKAEQDRIAAEAAIAAAKTAQQLADAKAALIKAQQDAADAAKVQAEAAAAALKALQDKAEADAKAAAEKAAEELKAAQDKTAAEKLAAEAAAKEAADKAAADLKAAQDKAADDLKKAQETGDAAKIAAAQAAKDAADKAIADAKTAAEKAIKDAKDAADAAALAAKAVSDKALAEAQAAADKAIAEAQADAEKAAAEAAAKLAAANLNVAGNVVTPAQIAANVAAKAEADKIAADAALKESNRQSIITILQDRFAKYGMTGLGNKIKELAIDGATEATITLGLQETDEYKTRFKANQERLDKGLRVLQPAEYLNLEDGYRQVLRSYGLTAFDNDEYVQQFIANDVSAAELSNRVVTAVQRVQNADPAVSKQLRDYYGIGSTDLVAYVLDPNQQMQKIERQVAAAEIGVAAGRQGLTAGVGVAEQLAAQGVSQAEAQKGYATIADILPTAEKLSAIYGETTQKYGQNEAEQEVFNSLASAQRARQKLSALEVAQFGGSSGLARGGLTQQASGNF